MFESAVSSLTGSSIALFSVVIAFVLSLIGAVTTDVFEGTKFKEGAWIVIAAVLLALFGQPVFAEIHKMLGTLIAVIAGLTLGFGLFRLMWAALTEGGTILSEAS